MTNYTSHSARIDNAPSEPELAAAEKAIKSDPKLTRADRLMLDGKVEARREYFLKLARAI